MDEIPQTSIEEFGHLGIVSAIINKHKIAKRIDKLIPKSLMPKPGYQNPLNLLNR
jgi:Mn-containing catalase